MTRRHSKNVTVRKGTSTFSYLCAPSCENALQVGANADYFSSVSSGMSTKLQLSTSAGQLSEQLSPSPTEVPTSGYDTARRSSGAILW